MEGRGTTNHMLLLTQMLCLGSCNGLCARPCGLTDTHRLATAIRRGTDPNSSWDMVGEWRVVLHSR